MYEGRGLQHTWVQIMNDYTLHGHISHMGPYHIWDHTTDHNRIQYIMSIWRMGPYQFTTHSTPYMYIHWCVYIAHGSLVQSAYVFLSIHIYGINIWSGFCNMGSCQIFFCRIIAHFPEPEGHQWYSNGYLLGTYVTFRGIRVPREHFIHYYPPCTSGP